MLIGVLLLAADLKLSFASAGDATLRIRVFSEEDGLPVPGANVLLIAEEETIAAGSTNSDGYLQFSDIQADAYQLRVSFLGYQTYETEVRLVANYVIIEEVNLLPAVEELEELLIEAADGAAFREAGRQRISPRDLDRIPTPGPGGDLAMYLQTLPGVVTAGDRGGEMFIRGGTPSQNIILMDDIQLTQPFHISNLFSAFPGHAIQDAEFYAGGFGAEYAGGISSVIDVSLRQGNMRSYTGETSVSPYLASVYAEGPIVSDWQSLLVSGRKSMIHHTAGALTGEENPMEFYDLLFRYTNQLSNLTCNITGLHTYDQGQINPIRDLNLTWMNTALGGRCLVFDPILNHAYDLSVGVSHYRNTEGTPGHTERQADIWRLNVKVERDYDLMELPIRLGLKWHVSSYSALLDERFALSSDLHGRVASLQGYATTTWEPTDNLILYPGLTSQFSTGMFTPSFEPRLRLTYRPFGGEFSEISVAGGRYVQLIENLTDERDAGTVFSVWKPVDMLGKPKPTAWHGILGYRQRMGNRFEATIEGYIKHLQNIAVSKWTPEARFEIETVFADGLSYGADLRAEYDHNSLYLLFGYDWSIVSYEAGVDDLGAWIDGEIHNYHPSHDIRHQLSAMAAYEVAGFTTSVRWELATGQPYTRIRGNDIVIPLPNRNPQTYPGTVMTIFDEPFGARLPSSHRLDVSVERNFEFSPRLSFQTEIGAINIYDRNNIFYYDSATFQRVDQMPFLPYFAISANYH